MIGIYLLNTILSTTNVATNPAINANYAEKSIPEKKDKNRSLVLFNEAVLPKSAYRTMREVGFIDKKYIV